MLVVVVVAEPESRVAAQLVFVGRFSCAESSVVWDREAASGEVGGAPGVWSGGFGWERSAAGRTREAIALAALFGRARDASALCV